jgi:hypothetical protein
MKNTSPRAEIPALDPLLCHPSKLIQRELAKSGWAFEVRVLPGKKSRGLELKLSKGSVYQRVRIQGKHMEAFPRPRKVDALWRALLAMAQEWLGVEE